MKRLLAAVYGILCYLAFLASFIYLIGFTANVVFPKTIDSPPQVAPAWAILKDIFLIALFALQHLIMARPSFKVRWTRIIPEPLERSTFVLIASLALGVLYWLWEPIPTVVWSIQSPWLRFALWTGFLFGWVLIVHSSFLIDHFDLFGLRQIYLYAQRKPYTPVPFKVHSLYKLVRHPMMLGFLMSFWSIPEMSVGHLVLSLGLTLLAFAGMRLEERDLTMGFGAAYQEYRRKTSMVIPLPGLRAGRPSIGHREGSKGVQSCHDCPAGGDETER